MASSQPVPVVVAAPTYANIGRRIVAYLIDGLIALAILLSVSFSMRALRSLGIWTPTAMEDPVAAWMQLGGGSKTAVIACYIVMMGLFYFAFLESSAWQATLGKRLMSVYVVDANGGRPSLGRALARGAVKCLLNALYGIGTIANLITAAAAPNHRALHDMSAKTFVLKGRPEQDSLELWRMVAAFGVQYLWMMMTFLLVF